MIAPYGPRAAARGNVVGIAVATLGGVLVVVGSLVDWYSPGSVKLQDIVYALDNVSGAKALPKAYFGWLMWVLLALAGAAAMFGNVPSPASTLCRVASPVLAVLAVVLACVSLSQLIEGRSIFDHAAAGLWLVLAGFVVIGVGGVLGPRRGAASPPYSQYA